MILYKSKIKKISGTSYGEIVKKARVIYHKTQSKSRRKTYLRSAYFKKEKIFIDLFWEHLNQKPKRDRVRRLKFFSCAIDLIENSRNKPTTKPNPNSKNELLHRFGAVADSGELFYIQIRENTKTKRKDFMSVFPGE